MTTAPDFPADVVDAVIRHMNDDHADDNLLVVRAFGGGDVDDARMVSLDARGGYWEWRRGDERGELSVPWPGGEIATRPEIRREIVALYDVACARLGVTPRPHD